MAAHLYFKRMHWSIVEEGLHAGVGLTMDGLQYRNMGQGFLSYSRGQPNWPVPAGMGSPSLRLISKLWLRAWKPGCQQPVSQGRVESRCPHSWKQAAFLQSSLEGLTKHLISLWYVSNPTSEALQIQTTQNISHVSWCSRRGRGSRMLRPRNQVLMQIATNPPTLSLTSLSPLTSKVPLHLPFPTCPEFCQAVIRSPPSFSLCRH